MEGRVGGGGAGIGVQKDVAVVVKALLECLSAACGALQQVHDKNEGLRLQLTTQHHEAGAQIAHAFKTHTANMQRLQTQLDHAVAAHAAHDTSAQEALEQSRAAYIASEVGGKLLQQQVAVLQQTVEEVERRAAQAAAVSTERVQELEREIVCGVTARTGLESQIVELERLAVQERVCDQDKLTKALSELDQVRAELARFTQGGVVLTPRPSWEAGGAGEGGGSSSERVANLLKSATEGGERVRALEVHIVSLTAALQETKEGVERETVLRTSAEEISQKLAATLQEIQDRPRAHASCGCPEPPEDGQVVVVELSEYLSTYLSKRFGLQGHMASWEVEKMSKDLGWIMEQPVRSAV